MYIQVGFGSEQILEPLSGSQVYLEHCLDLKETGSTQRKTLATQHETGTNICLILGNSMCQYAHVFSTVTFISVYMSNIQKIATKVTFNKFLLSMFQPTEDEPGLRPEKRPVRVPGPTRGCSITQ